MCWRCSVEGLWFDQWQQRQQRLQILFYQSDRIQIRTVSIMKRFAFSCLLVSPSHWCLCSFLVSPAFPSDPVLEDPGPVLLGQETEYHCNVFNIFSANQLRFSWLSGNETLMMEMYKSSGSLQNISSVLKHQFEKVQQVLTCRVELLTEDRDVWKSRRTSIPLQIHCK